LAQVVLKLEQALRRLPSLRSLTLLPGPLTFLPAALKLEHLPALRRLPSLSSPTLLLAAWTQVPRVVLKLERALRRPLVATSMPQSARHYGRTCRLSAPPRQTAAHRLQQQSMALHIPAAQSSLSSAPLAASRDPAL
jgi:hypothetical protein